MNLEASIQTAVVESMAAEVLKSIKTEHRDAILHKSIADALGSYSFKNAIEKLVAETATEIVGEMLKSEKYTVLLREAVKNGVDSLIDQIPQATAAATAEALFGKMGKDSYDRRPGLILKHLKS